ncbi:MAG: hypothetical protein OXC42_04040 [Gammaproteobacteria bacterium]|nr:hypothetical protein [Gammaproteobacteria bacterium]
MRLSAYGWRANLNRDRGIQELILEAEPLNEITNRAGQQFSMILPLYLHKPFLEFV